MGYMCFKLYTGDRRIIRAVMLEFATQNAMELQYSSNIQVDLAKQYGFFFKPKVLYFVYDATMFPDKETIDSFLQAVNNSKCPIICIVEEIDKRSTFYKAFSKQIEVLGKIQQEPTLDDKVNAFYKDISNLSLVTNKEAVSFLYKLFYDFRRQKYKRAAGFCINAVLTGCVKVDDILKLFLIKSLDK